MNEISKLIGLTPCGCKTTGHDSSCWLSLGGTYVNGVKVAPAYVLLPPPVVIYGPVVVGSGPYSSPPNNWWEGA
jgi:hypothetical protein